MAGGVHGVAGGVHGDAVVVSACKQRSDRVEADASFNTLANVTAAVKLKQELLKSKTVIYDS